VLKQTLQFFNGKLCPVICVDNDPAGEAFQSELKRAGISFSKCSPSEEFKDWNEQLTALKNSKPVSRLLDRQKQL